MLQLRIAIVDDDRLIVSLLQEYLGSVSGFEIVGGFHSSSDFYGWLESNSPPDILLLDLRLKDESGQKVIETITPSHPDVKIIVLSSHYHPNFLGYMFRKGVHAFIPKEVQKTELVEIIGEVAEKGHYLSNDQVKVLRKQIATNTPSIPENNLAGISDREKEVLELLCHQLTAREIADRLFISKKTVESHKANLLLKTGAKNLAGLIIFATQHKLVDPDEIML